MFMTLMQVACHYDWNVQLAVSLHQAETMILILSGTLEDHGTQRHNNVLVKDTEHQRQMAVVCMGAFT